MMRNKGRRGGATINRLQYGSFDLDKSLVIEKFSQGFNDACPGPKNLPYLGVYDKIGISLTITSFRIGEG